MQKVIKLKTLWKSSLWVEKKEQPIIEIHINIMFLQRKFIKKICMRRNLDQNPKRQLEKQREFKFWGYWNYLAHST